MNRRTFLCAATLALAAVSVASAQVDPGASIQYNWGAAHTNSGQATLLNFSVSNASGPLTVSVQLELHDQNGNMLYRNSILVSSGHSVTFAIGPTIRTIPADIYALIGPEVRTIQPSIKVSWPPGPTGTMPPPEQLLTPTLEVMDVVTGRVVAMANNPHAIIGVL
jgi:hypothetical protein